MKQEQNLFQKEHRRYTLLLTDSVLVQNENGDIFRPSDVGEPVEIVGSWTLEFSNGATLTTFNTTSFRLFTSGYASIFYVTLDNLLKASKLGLNNPIIFPEQSWDSNVLLSDYTHKTKGTFNIGDLDFAKFAGWFCARVAKKSGKDKYFFNTKKLEWQEAYLETLGIEEPFAQEGSRYVFKKNYLSELIDSLFNFTEVPSIPDELLFKANGEWFNSLMEGFISGVSHDSSCNAYNAPERLKMFLADLILGYNKTGKKIHVTHKKGCGENVLKITFPKRDMGMRILDGYENDTPVTLYDIGKGEFNASGIWLKEE